MEKAETYKVAEHIFTIADPDSSKAWARLKWHYEPFVADSVDCAMPKPEFNITVRKGRYDTAGMPLYFKDKEERPGIMSLDIYRQDRQYVFEISQPGQGTNGWLLADDEFTEMTLIIDEDNRDIKAGWHISTVTSGLMLAYMLATTTSKTLMSHSAAVIHRGKAYMFIGRSGTGKSTHTQLWLKNIPDVFHLNDDHPIARVSDDGRVMLYGSPWSGKNDVYHQVCAPLGGIVRLRQAPHNSITRLNPIEAYASLCTSFSGMTWDATLADKRHQALESLVSAVPCYTMDCLPDDDAAHVCRDFIVKTY